MYWLLNVKRPHAINQRLNSSTSSNTTLENNSSLKDAKNFGFDRVKNAKILIAMKNATGLVAWGMNTDRLEKLMICAKKDMENPDTDDDEGELKRTYKSAKLEYRKHIKT